MVYNYNFLKLWAVFGCSDNIRHTCKRKTFKRKPIYKKLDDFWALLKAYEMYYICLFFFLDSSWIYTWILSMSCTRMFLWHFCNFRISSSIWWHRKQRLRFKTLDRFSHLRTYELSSLQLKYMKKILFKNVTHCTWIVLFDILLANNKFDYE